MARLLTTPLAEAEVRGLAAGDIVYLTGTVFTARDEAHREMLKRGAPLDVRGLALYHCGPVAQLDGQEWRIVAAGPTTSARMEVFEDEFLRRFRPALVIGKGGMGDRTLAALMEVGAAYAHYTGGAGALAARSVKRVAAVYWLEDLGMPEAVWVLEVERFGPLVIAMDTQGRSLYADLAATVGENMKAVRKRIEGRRGRPPRLRDDRREDRTGAG